jgi:hypothetical protein
MAGDLTITRISQTRRHRLTTIARVSCGIHNRTRKQALAMEYRDLAELQPVEPGTREIPLSQGQVALVSAEDWEELSQFRWCASLRGHVPTSRQWEILERLILKYGIDEYENTKEETNEPPAQQGPGTK